MASHVYELKLNLHNRAGHFFQNVFHYNVAESGTGNPFTYADELISAWVTNTEADFLPIIGADATLDFIQGRRVTGGGGPTASRIRGQASTAANDSSSTGLCADILWITATANNRMGHTFIGCVPQDGLAADEFGNAYTLLIGTFISDQLAQLTLPGGLGTADFGIYTRKTGVINPVLDGQLRPKPTLLNKRTVPQI